MADACRADRWDRTAWLGSILINTQRAKGQRSVKPAEINPWLLARVPARQVTMAELMHELGAQPGDPFDFPAADRGGRLDAAGLAALEAEAAARKRPDVK